MISAVIIDDEERSRILLENLVKEYCKEVVVVGMAPNVDDGYALIKNGTPDIVFLDIEMQKESGFELLEKFDDINFEVIFTTAYEQYALKAIKFCAIDYLLKPIDITELKIATEKAVRRKQKQTLSKNLEVLMQNLHNNNYNQHQIALPTSDGLIFIQVNDILYCKSDGPYTNFYMRSHDRIMTSKNLKEYEDLLSEHNFFRVHHSWLINLHEIKKYIRGEGGYVMMSDGEKIDVSKRKKDEFLKKIAVR